MTTSRSTAAGPAGGPDGSGARAPGAPRIWAVGGGKGGIGKSVVTTNLAAAMAGAGRRCAVIDLDLGAANLHTLLGMPRPRYSLAQLLTGDVDALEDLLVQTSVPNLWIVSGHQALVEMADPRPSEKELLFRQIRELDVDEVFLDLGAGSASNVLDFFLLARRGLVVVTPEPTAVENAEHFLRAALYRSLQDVARRPDVASAIRRLRDDGRPRRVRSATELIALVRAIDPPAAKPLEERAEAFLPLLVVNQLRSSEQRGVGDRLVTACRERLGVALELTGLLDADPNVQDAVVRGQPVVQAFPLARFSRQVGQVAEQLQWGGARDATEAHGASRPRASAPITPAERETGPIDGEPVRRRLVVPPLDPAAPGESLRRCREALGLSIAELTDRTRIRILDDIENERFEALPPEPYLKGYLLEYARELGMVEIGELAASYLARCPAQQAPPSPRSEQPALARVRPARRFGRGWRS